jgi:hypothetical protein
MILMPFVELDIPIKKGFKDKKKSKISKKIKKRE